MSEQQTLEDLLYVGPVNVSLHYDRCGTATAKTMDVPGPYQGSEIHLTVHDEDYADALHLFGCPEMWKDVLRSMRGTLARCAVIGEVHPAPAKRLTNAETEKNLAQAIEELGKDFFTITLETARATLAERAADAEESKARREKWWAQRAEEDPLDLPF
jgi:hypothetical protein